MLTINWSQAKGALRMNDRSTALAAPGGSKWHRTSRSCDGGSCVEVAWLGEMIAVRDSKQPDGPIITCEPSEWRQFVKKIKNGTFDELI